jgi:hypothetical protein
VQGDDVLAAVSGESTKAVVEGEGFGFRVSGSGFRVSGSGRRVIGNIVLVLVLDDEDDLIGVICKCWEYSASLAVSDPELNLDQLL